MVKRKPKPGRGYNHVKKCFANTNLHRNIIKRLSKPKTTFYVKGKNSNVQKNSPYQLKEEGPTQYSMYFIVNSSYFTNRGSLIASVVRASLNFYNKLAKDRVKSRILDDWEDTGEKFIVYKGINHNHLKYLAEDLNFAAVDSHPFYKTWGRSRLMLVLSAIGKEEDLEDIFEGLSYFR